MSNCKLCARGELQGVAKGDGEEGGEEAGGGQLETGGRLFNKCFYSASVLHPPRCAQRA